MALLWILCIDSLEYPCEWRIGRIAPTQWNKKDPTFSHKTKEQNGIVLFNIDYITPNYNTDYYSPENFPQVSKPTILSTSQFYYNFLHSILVQSFDFKVAESISWCLY